MGKAAHRIAKGAKMKDLVQKLKDLRSEQSQAIEQLNKARSVLEQTEEYKVYLQCEADMQGVNGDIKDTDQAIRDKAIKVYKETSNKNPADGVSVVINKICEYDEGRATIWATNNAIDMLTIDKKPFEKHAKQVSDTLPLEFVTIKEEPSVRIASKL